MASVHEETRGRLSHQKSSEREKKQVRGRSSDHDDHMRKGNYDESRSNIKKSKEYKSATESDSNSSRSSKSGHRKHSKRSKSRSESHRKRRKRDDRDNRKRQKHDLSPKNSRRKTHHRLSDKRSSDSEDSRKSDSDQEEIKGVNKEPNKTLNPRLLEKLAARGETLEEREERRARRRAARVANRFGYSSDNNPFNDPNLHDTFIWKKKDQAIATEKNDKSKLASGKDKTNHILEEIEKVRKRRKDRELQQDEMERMRAEENKMKELANYDEWARKEEEFHLLQQRQRSAIRLLEHREQPIDILAKNLLLFGLSNEDKLNRAKVKYQERFDALTELETNLEAELLEPHMLLKDLKLEELQSLLTEMKNFRQLEHDAMFAVQRETKDCGAASAATSEMIIRYWDNLIKVCHNEIDSVKSAGTTEGAKTKTLTEDILKLFENKSVEVLEKMRLEVQDKVNSNCDDKDYWSSVLNQLEVHLAKEELMQLHNVMLVRQLERLEKRKEELGKLMKAKEDKLVDPPQVDKALQITSQDLSSMGIEPDFGNLEESLGLNAEVSLDPAQEYAPWMDRYRPRKPRYFNRVKTGYDWNKYNQTHYDHDNPPPKIVQGYKFNIFYPELLDRESTPRYSLEATGDGNNEFCILRFSAGPPYEDIAFKIINREWNKSRKRGFRCTFERGVLSLYFNFKSHWYRR